MQLTICDNCDEKMDYTKQPRSAKLQSYVGNNRAITVSLHIEFVDEKAALPDLCQPCLRMVLLSALEKLSGAGEVASNGTSEV